MDNTNETSLQIINNKGFLAKIVNFFKNLFVQGDLIQDYSNTNSREEKNNKSFINNIKFEEDKEKVKLLKIQVIQNGVTVYEGMVEDAPDELKETNYKSADFDSGCVIIEI